MDRNCGQVNVEILLGFCVSVQNLQRRDEHHFRG